MSFHWGFSGEGGAPTNVQLQHTRLLIPCSGLELEEGGSQGSESSHHLPQTTIKVLMAPHGGTHSCSSRDTDPVSDPSIIIMYPSQADRAQRVCLRAKRSMNLGKASGSSKFITISRFLPHPAVGMFPLLSSPVVCPR